MNPLLIPNISSLNLVAWLCMLVCVVLKATYNVYVCGLRIWLVIVMVGLGSGSLFVFQIESELMLLLLTFL
jgi:hypothetical protein